MEEIKIDDSEYFKKIEEGIKKEKEEIKKLLEED